MRIYRVQKKESYSQHEEGAKDFIRKKGAEGCEPGERRGECTMDSGCWGHGKCLKRLLSSAKTEYKELWSGEGRHRNKTWENVECLFLTSRLEILLTQEEGGSLKGWHSVGLGSGAGIFTTSDLRAQLLFEIFMITGLSSQHSLRTFPFPCLDL